ncbi:MAG: hypothetical protein DVB23_001310 [Verrucomicrobia bacterium]|jgi:hypothetical protein|nr:MAG: hypothetical protein DVB23_001310 [Verrucomicrobiota bacterium]
MKPRAGSVFERGRLRLLKPKVSTVRVETSLMSDHQDQKHARSFPASAIAAPILNDCESCVIHLLSKGQG